MKYFIFNWFKYTKYHEPIQRKNLVQAQDSATAIKAFTKVFGSLKKNAIVSIQEVTKQGKAIGAPISAPLTDVE